MRFLNFQALAFIGKSVTTDNSKISRAEAKGEHDVRFNLPADSQLLRMIVKDADGNVVRTLESKNAKAGKNELNWNGMTEDGTAAPIGDYNVSIEAVSSNGRKLHVETKTDGIITGVNFSPKGPQLMVGQQVVNMSDVKSISEPSAMPAAINQLNLNSVPNEGPKKAEVKAETRSDSEKRASLSKGNLNDAAMSQGLINTLEKEGAKAGM